MQFTTLSAGKLAALALLTAQFSLASPTYELKQRTTPIVLGAASSWGAISSTTLTSTGGTKITGNCGTCPGTSITGFPPGVCTGTTSAGGTAACNAEAGCKSAYNNAKALSATSALPASDLGGLSLAPGVYTFPADAVTLTGSLTLNGASNSKGQWIFKINTTFTTAVSSKVLLINGAQACNVYFIVGTSASVGGASNLQGNILANTSISASEAASNKGTWCAINAAITLIDNALTAQTTCST